MINPTDLALHLPTVLVPSAQVSLDKWSVIACDQYTSNPDYWGKVRRLVGESPSTLDLILPEVYLGDPDVETKIQRIKAQMRTYLNEKKLIPLAPGFILIDRQTPYVPSRKGLLLAIDLEKYDYQKGAKSLIRPTEETITNRLPPRIRIREGGDLEIPHIMLLLDDPDLSVIEPLFSQTEKMAKIYDFELMMNGGHLTGYHLNNQELLNQTFAALSRLIAPEVIDEKYGANVEPFLFAVGDGNHSLATAKACWEKLKGEILDPAVLCDHPARYCLVEVVNLYDDGIIFHPIHRLLFNVDLNQFLTELQNDCPCQVTIETAPTGEPELSAHPEIQRFRFCSGTTAGTVTIGEPHSNLVVGSLQPFLDLYLARHPETRIDYIHGTRETMELGSQPGNLALFLPPMPKEELFPTVIRDGALPRKTFSMGEAEEKRFYLEARKITLD